MTNDRNFDDLAEKFQKKIYGSLKGQVRLAVLRRDLNQAMPQLLAEKPLKILDAGGGQGQLSLYYASLGHQITLCDISKNMLLKAEEAAQKLGVTDNVTYLHDAVQNLKNHSQQPYDLILNHALLEWVQEPREILSILSAHLLEGGLLSTAFYNHTGVLFRNLVRGNLFKVKSKNWQGHQGSLTPSNPPNVDEVASWYATQGLEIILRSGIRVFSDYLSKQKLAQISAQDIIEMELEYAQHPDLWRMARYIHLLGRR